VAEFEIREMTSKDVDAVGDVTAAGGFGDRRELFRMAIEMTDCRPILAVSEDRPIGTGLGPSTATQAGSASSSSHQSFVAAASAGPLPRPFATSWRTLAAALWCWLRPI